MSFILDALKKSEAERQRQAGPALLEMRVVAPQRRLPLWAIAVGVLLLVNIAVLGWLAWHRAPAAAPTARASTSDNGAAAAGVAGASQTPVVNAEVVAPAALQPQAVAAPDALAPAGDSVRQSGQQSLPELVDAAAAATEADNPADLQPAVNAAPPATRPAASHSGAGAGAAAGSSLQTYAELSGKLPELRLDLHVYAAKPADRYAFINMHKVREGDVTPEGVRVAEITNDGVVLDYRGTEFLLGHQ